MRQRHRPPTELGREKRAGVEVGVVLDRPGDQHTRKGLAGGQPQEGIVLVIAQQDVVARHPLLDQIVFECQRLHHRVGDNDLETGHVVEEGVMARAHAISAEVVAHPVAKGPCLADVNRLAARVTPQIHPGLLGQSGDLILEVVNGHDLL
jgi:hypothetical protein